MAARRSDPPSALISVWLPVAVVSLLRGLPFLVTRLAPPPEGRAWIPTGYLPADLLSYVAMIREVGDSGSWVWSNPYDTVSEGGRFLLPFFGLLGQLSSWTGIDPFWMFELSRVPLLAGFFLVLRRILPRIVRGRREEVCAAWLIALSGGLEVLVRPLLGWLPAYIAEPAAFDLSPLHGWSTFGSFYNPLWVASLTLAFPILVTILEPGRRRPVGLLAAGIFALYWIHPYSAIVVLAACFVPPLVFLAMGEWPDIGSWSRVGRAVVLALFGIALGIRWQTGDEAFSGSAANLFGTQLISGFWYPVTLGALLPFSILGWRRRVAERDPWAAPLTGWIVTVVFLHHSPLLNGYHFVFHLHLPLCLLAAPEVARTLGDTRLRLARLGWMTVLFASSVALTVGAVRGVYRWNLVPAWWTDLAAALSREPPGRVVCPPGLGNALPALGPHRVWVGHWFLTPRYRSRSERFERVVVGGEPGLGALVDEARADLLVAPVESRGHVESELAGRIAWRRVFGAVDLYRLEEGEG